MSLKVWAPNAKFVELIFDDGTTLPLEPAERGHFVSPQDIPDEARYLLKVDGKGPFPDPEAEFLPLGVHGPSEKHQRNYVFENSAFEPVPLSQAVIYELHVGTFSEPGTFLGAIDHLDHLSDLGVSHIELMPVCAFPGNQGWGYDGVALFAPHAPYGTPDDLKRFVDEAHARGMAVILDLVLNHLGPDGNYLGVYGPYFTDRYKTPWGQAVNLDGPESDLVRETLVRCALHWLREYRIDGLRLDAVHALFDQSAVHFLEELSSRVALLGKSTGRRLVLIAECDLNDPRYVRPPTAGGLGMDAHWCDDFHHALHAYFTGESDGYYEDYGSLGAVAKALRQGYVFDGVWSPHRRRLHGRPPAGVSQDQLVVCIQNHDQVGNRARGERIAQLVSRPQLFQMAALCLLSPFVPLLFQGEEWGTERPFLYFTDHQDEKLAKSVTEGRRREFGHFASYQWDVPDPQQRSTFERSRLDWKERAKSPHAELLKWYKRLIHLRGKHQLGDKPDIAVSFDESAGWLSLRRGGVSAFFNFSQAPQSIPGLAGAEDVLLSYPSQALGAGGEVAADSTIVVRGA